MRVVDVLRGEKPKGFTPGVSDKVRPDNQSQDRQRARAYRTTRAARASIRGDRIAFLAAVHESLVGTFETW